MLPDGLGIPIDPATASNHSLLVLAQGPSETDHGREIQFVGLGRAQAIRRSASLTLQDRRQVLRQIEIGVKQTGLEVVSQAEVNRKVRTNLPGVLDIRMQAL